MVKITGLVLTFNEEMHIERCLSSLTRVCDEVFVVDSFSKDKTLDICGKFRVNTASRAFISQADQLNWAIDNLPISGDWILRLDADEYLSDELAAELQPLLSNVSAEVTGIILPLVYIFLGRRILHGDRFPLKLLRLWRRGVGRLDGRLMDERVALSAGQTIEANNLIIHEDLRSLSSLVDKHNAYATREAIASLLERHSKDRLLDESNKHSRKRLRFKIKFYGRLPPLLRPILYFLYRYIARGGFLDGWQGLIYHSLQGGWYRFLVDAKILEFEYQLANSARGAPEIATQLSKYGLLPAAIEGNQKRDEVATV